MLRRLDLTENQPPRPFELSADEAEALASADLAVVTRTPGSSTWEVAAGRKVGVAQLGKLQVVVRPKISVDRLVFLMGYARQPQFWRDSPALLDVAPDLAEALADSFVRRGRKALEQGLLQGYVEVTDAIPVVRGRIRVGDQLSRRPGTLLPLEVTYDEFSVDTAENQILLAATLRLLRLPTLSRDHRHGLQRLRLQLADVSTIARGRPLPTWHPSRLNIRYQPALILADLILAGDSFEQRYGSLHISGFVFDMWKIYEDFVSVALREAVRPYGGRSSLQRQLHLDEDRRVDMRPDFYWSRGAGHRVVADAKYKAEKPAGFPNADLYQMLAYCTVLGTDEGHLVYAEGNADKGSHTVLGSGVRIRCHTLDLSCRPTNLLQQIDDLASKFAGNSAPRISVQSSGPAALGTVRRD